MVLAHLGQGECNLEGGDHDQPVHTWSANEATSTRNFGKVRSNRGSVWAVNVSKLTSSLKKLGHQTKSTEQSD